MEFVINLLHLYPAIFPLSTPWWSGLPSDLLPGTDLFRFSTVAASSFFRPFPKTIFVNATQLEMRFQIYDKRLIFGFVY